MKNLIMVLAFGIVAMGAWAQCVPGQPMENVATGYQQLQSYVLGTNVLTKFWEVGNAQGANSGTLASSSMAEDYGGGTYYVYTDWGLSGVVGCPAPSGRTAFLYSEANAGAAKFLVMSVAKSGGFWNFDAITNGPGNTPSSVAIPAPTGDTWQYGLSRRDEAIHYITWNPLTSAQLRGYYDSDPGANMVTGYAIRYWPGPLPVTSYATSAWALASVVPIGPNGSDPGMAPVSIPASQSCTTIALSVLFDGQVAGSTPGLRETAFVGSSTLTLPAPGEIYGESWTGKTRLSWTAWPDTPRGMPALYSVARGQQPDLPHLLDSQADSCSLASYSSNTYTDDASEPCPGEFYWYLVMGSEFVYCACCSFGWGDDGWSPGSWGYATAGERIVNYSGACATPDPCP